MDALILSCGTGGGHNAAGRAIMEELQRRGHHAEMFNPYNLVSNRLAEEVGHTIIPPKPSLVPLESADPCCPQMQGLALRNVMLRVKNKKNKVVYQEQGELLFTHFGLSGPLI